MLATIVALVIVRLERAGARGIEASVALTERFVEVMESEHREMGLGDPDARPDRAQTGRPALARRVEHVARRGRRWRRGSKQRAQASMEARSLPTCSDHSATALREFWSRLEKASDQALIEGRLS